MQDKKLYLRIIINLLITIALFLLSLIFVPKIITFFFPFILAFFLSLIANPIVRFMENTIRIQRKHGSAIIVIGVIVSIVGFIYYLISVIIDQAGRLIEDLPNLTIWLSELMQQLSVRLEHASDLIPESLIKELAGLDQQAGSLLTNIFNKLKIPSIAKAGSYLKVFTEAIFTVIVTILATYFMIAERDKIAEILRKQLPPSVLKGYRLIVTCIRTAIGAYFKAQFKIMFILVAVMYATFLILHIDYAFLLALGIGFIDLLPVFGTGLIFWPWAVVDFLTQNYVRAIVIMVLYLACQIIKQVLQPKMVGDGIGIRPFTALLLMFVGYQINGVLGMILGLPFGMVLISFYKNGVFDHLIRGIKILIQGINDYRRY